VDLTSCILGKFSVVPIFVARRFQERIDTTDPSCESWNYLLRRLSFNFENLTPSSPFRDSDSCCKSMKRIRRTQLAHVYLKHELQQIP